MQKIIARVLSRLGSESAIKAKVFDSGELVIASDTPRCVVGDGITMGGRSLSPVFHKVTDLADSKDAIYKGDVIFYKNALWTSKVSGYLVPSISLSDFDPLSSATDDVTLTRDINGLYIIKDGGITSAKLNASLSSALEFKANKNVANGYAPLDASILVPAANLPLASTGVTTTGTSVTTVVTPKGLKDAGYLSNSIITADKASTWDALGVIRHDGGHYDFTHGGTYDRASIASVDINLSGKFQSYGEAWYYGTSFFQDIAYFNAPAVFGSDVTMDYIVPPSGTFSVSGNMNVYDVNANSVTTANIGSPTGTLGVSGNMNVANVNATSVTALDIYATTSVTALDIYVTNGLHTDNIVPPSGTFSVSGNMNVYDVNANSVTALDIYAGSTFTANPSGVGFFGHSGTMQQSLYSYPSLGTYGVFSNLTDATNAVNDLVAAINNSNAASSSNFLGLQSYGLFA